MFKNIMIPHRRGTPLVKHSVRVLLLNVSESYRQWSNGSWHALNEVMPVLGEWQKRRGAKEREKGDRSRYRLSKMKSVEQKNSVRIRNLHGLHKICSAVLHVAAAYILDQLSRAIEAYFKVPEGSRRAKMESHFNDCVLHLCYKEKQPHSSCGVWTVYKESMCAMHVDDGRCSSAGERRSALFDVHEKRKYRGLTARRRVRR